MEENKILMNVTIEIFHCRTQTFHTIAEDILKI